MALVRRSRRAPRTVTVTLAWFLPVNVRNQAYRMAKLEVNGDFKTEFGTPRIKHQPNDRSIPRCPATIRMSGLRQSRRASEVATLRVGNDGELAEMGQERDRAASGTIGIKGGVCPSGFVGHPVPRRGERSEPGRGTG